jgi:hypothetical protein
MDQFGWKLELPDNFCLKSPYRIWRKPLERQGRVDSRGTDMASTQDVSFIGKDSRNPFPINLRSSKHFLFSRLRLLWTSFLCVRGSAGPRLVNECRQSRRRHRTSPWTTAQRPVETSCQTQRAGITGFAERISVNMSYRTDICQFLFVWAFLCLIQLTFPRKQKWDWNPFQLLYGLGVDSAANSTRKLLGGKERLARKADHLTATCKPII